MSSPRRSNRLNKRLVNKAKPTPVILVTDIGNDIDDTIALFLLLGAKNLNVVAIVTSVNNGLERGRVVRGFLRVLGIRDNQIEILPSQDHCQAGCYVPEQFPNTTESNMGQLSKTPSRLIEICEEHMDTGVVLMGIASLSPIAEALKIDSKGKKVMQKAIKKVYLQGNADILKSGCSEVSEDPLLFEKEITTLLPNETAYNFHNDLEAAKTVFDHLQSKSEFTLLGKYAAYKVPVYKGDFALWTDEFHQAHSVTVSQSRLLKKKEKVPYPPSLLETAKRQMQHFREGNPSKFDSLYAVPNGLSEEELNSFFWFDSLPDNFICSRPYDPLLALILIKDLEGEEIMKPYYCLNEEGIKHRLFGNNLERHSVTDGEFVHDVLVEYVSKGLVSKLSSPSCI